MYDGKYSMQTLRPLTSDDIAMIAAWPAYPSEFSELDYALRENGWLAEYSRKADTWLFALEDGGDLQAFTILSKTADTAAEFRIALRADCIGKGLGRNATALTLRKGLNELGLSQIHLIVRKNNPRAARLYRSLGFIETGECRKTINAKPVAFLEMRLSKQAASD